MVGCITAVALPGFGDFLWGGVIYIFEGLGLWV